MHRPAGVECQRPDADQEYGQREDSHPCLERVPLKDIQVHADFLLRVCCYGHRCDFIKRYMRFKECLRGRRIAQNDRSHHWPATREGHRHRATLYPGKENNQMTEPIAKVPISSLPPGGGGLELAPYPGSSSGQALIRGWGEGCHEIITLQFTHPLTPSREGRGDHILKSFAIGSTE